MLTAGDLNPLLAGEMHGTLQAGLAGDDQAAGSAGRRAIEAAALTVE